MVETKLIEGADGQVSQMWFIKIDGLTVWSTFVKSVAMKKIQQVGEKKNDNSRTE